MSLENTINPTGSTPRAPKNTGICSLCGEAASHLFDEKLGYYKKCSRCGHVEYLNRRFLRLDRRSRQWH